MVSTHAPDVSSCDARVENSSLIPACFVSQFFCAITVFVS